MTDKEKLNHQNGDWPEDFVHENGNYMRKCIECGNTFSGYKRRVVCKKCAAITALNEPEPATNQQAQAKDERVIDKAAFDKWFDPDSNRNYWHCWQAAIRYERAQLARDVPGWISVKDRLPADGDAPVAVRTKCGQFLTAWASYWRGSSTSFAHWTFPHDSDEDVIVTHWTPLPPAEGNPS